MGAGDFCYYQVAAESANSDQFLSIKLENYSGIRMNVVIANTLDDQYVDLCTGLSQNDVLFARFPFKFFPVFESYGNRGVFQANAVFRGNEFDLPLTKNRFKCRRV